MRTTADFEQELGRMRARLAEYENERITLWNEHLRRENAIRQIRAAMEEAIAFTGRWKDLANLAPGGFENAFRKRVIEAGRLSAYFKMSKARFEDALSGFPLQGEPERFEHESAGNHVGEGDKQGSAKQEPARDSGEAAVAVDAGGSAAKPATE